MIAQRVIEVIEVPSNQGMQLTIESVTPFAYAKVAPLLLAADPRCYATTAVERWLGG